MWLKRPLELDLGGQQQQQLVFYFKTASYTAPLHRRRLVDSNVMTTDSGRQRPGRSTDPSRPLYLGLCLIPWGVSCCVVGVGAVKRSV